MNFLGHCLFSEPTPSAMAGSLWPDFAPKPKIPVSTEFIEHFDRHQQIDKLTDSTPILEPLRVELRPIFRKTTPVVIDMLLDHHLASQWSVFHQLPLAEFAQDTYQSLHAFDELPMPERLQKTLFWMRAHNWFVSYTTTEGLENAMMGIARRLRFANPMHEHRAQAADIARQHQQAMTVFIEDLSAQFRK